MQIKNSHKKYGLVAILLHWVMGIVILGLFAVGYWMVDLTYYSSWYRVAPYWHKAIGMLLVFAFLFRLFWKTINIRPDDSDISAFERFAAHATHHLIYALLATIMFSGYLISTLDGRSIDLWGIVEIPAFFTDRSWEQLVGEVHWIAAYILMGLVVLHAAAAFKHHFKDKDNTLKKMLGRD